ncbi:MAG: hypothetical protein EBZ74_04640 [Planctomycetia bacterium]|nr:hypothetical protein [Planctomycetia bacterium]
MTRSEFGYFCAGVAAGALGHKFYPQLKEQLGPYMAGAMVFAQQAFGDAMKDALATVDSMQKAAEPVGAEFFGVRPAAAAPAAGAEHAAA